MAIEKMAVIGSPVAHSLSPEMHNKAFQEYGLNYVYERMHVEAHDLARAMEAIRTGPYKGFNVTIPHKVAVMQFLDEIDESAQKIGAVNTVVNNNGKLYGFNTDGKGFIKGLIPILQKPFHQMKVCVIGAGGASRAIVAALLEEGIQVLFLANRTLSNSEDLIQLFSGDQRLQSISLKDAEEIISSVDLIVNTTSVGMHPFTENVPLSLLHLQPKTLVVDIIYNPLWTKWLLEAKDRGAVVDNGISMFVHQGALAFKKWTGIYPNQDIMRNKVLEQLRRKTC